MLSKKYAKLDKLFSEFIRRRAMLEVGGCQRCLTAKRDWKELQCAHFHGRVKASVRFDESNAIGLCGACHIYFHSRPLEHVEFFKGLLGEEEFDLLNARTRVPARYLDKSAITIYYKQKIEVLKGSI